MEKMVCGEVECQRISNSRAVRRFVEKCIERWAQTQSRVLSKSLEKPYFHVTFVRERNAHIVDCKTRIWIGSEMWEGSVYGNSIQNALKESLNHLNSSSSLTVPSWHTPV